MARFFWRFLPLLLILGACSDGPAQSLEGVNWDGEQFVIPGSYGTTEYWTSTDGVDWDRFSSPAGTTATPRCEEPFDCDAATPADQLDLPLLFTTTTNWGIVQRDELLLMHVGSAYTSTVDEDLRIKVHPSIMDRAANDSDCFHEILDWELAGTNNKRPIEAFIVGMEHNPLPIAQTTIRCQVNNVEDSFTINWLDIVSKEEATFVENTSLTDLFVLDADGGTTRVDDPPMSESPYGQLDLAPIVTTADAFWSIESGSLVQSSNGINWAPMAIPQLDGAITQVVASFGSDIAVLTLSNAPTPEQQVATVLVSNDDGATWPVSYTSPLAGIDLDLVAVGPLGFGLQHDATLDVTVFNQDGEEIVVVPEPDVRSAAVAIGADRVVATGYNFDESGQRPFIRTYDSSGNMISEQASP